MNSQIYFTKELYSKLKFVILLICCLGLSACNTSESDNKKPLNKTRYTDGPSFSIEQIKEQLLAIDQSSTSTVDTLEYSCYDDPSSGRVIIKKEGKKLLLISHFTDSGDNDWQEFTVYFNAVHPIFIYEKDSYWMDDIENSDPDDPDTNEIIREKRSYFSESKILECWARKAEGPVNEVDALLANTKNEKGACNRLKLLRLAELLSGVKTVADLEDLYCSEE